jgi:hypothetical protein
MFKSLLKQIVVYKAQICFCLIGLFLTRETYYLIAFPYAFDNDGMPLSLILRLKLLLIASLFWLPLILAIPLFQMPLNIRRIFAVWQLPAFASLLVILLLLLFLEAPKIFNGELSRYTEHLWLIGAITAVSGLVIAIGYFEIQLFFAAKKTQKLK